MIKDKYRRVTLTTVTPDGEEDVTFSVECSCSCSDERDVGLSECEISVDFKEETLEVDDETLHDYLCDKLANGDFDEDIYDVLICAWNDYVLDQAEEARLAVRCCD